VVLTSRNAIEGIIFDFDGVILDTETPEYESWRQILARYRIEMPEALWATGIGASMDDLDLTVFIEQQLGHAIDRPKVRAEQRFLSDELIHKENVMPGIVETLRRARELGLKTGIASSSDHNWVDGYLDKFGLRIYFDCVCCGEDVPKAKPDPALYFCALNRLQLSPQKTVAFEDSPNGINSAKTAGLYCVAVPNLITRNLDLKQADMVIDSLAKISLDQVFARLNLD
jgi:HAD superfamily hydrolase (TIGR01509 family)